METCSSRDDTRHRSFVRGPGQVGALRVREAVQQPHQPRGRLGVELPGRQAVEQRPLFGATALRTLIEALFPAFAEPLLGPLLHVLRRHRSSSFQRLRHRQPGLGEPEPARQHHLPSPASARQGCQAPLSGVSGANSLSGVVARDLSGQMGDEEAPHDPIAKCYRRFDG